MNTENDSQEKSGSAVSTPTDAQEPTDKRTDEVKEGAKTSPLTTYESVNADAPVVTSSVIEQRLAKIKGVLAEKSAVKPEEGATAPESEERREQKKTYEGKPRDRGPRGAGVPRGNRPGRERGGDDDDNKSEKHSKFEKKPRVINFPTEPISKVPVPSIRKNSDQDDIEQQLEELFQDKPLEKLMENVDKVASQEIFEEGMKINARIVSLLKESAVVELGSREQGMIPLKQFPEDQNPEIGATVECVITRYNPSEGIFEVSLPLAAAEVGDWSSISEGMIVEARITGSNKGGLECEVGKLRAFMPIGQVATFRVENPDQFIGERWKCLVTEANPQRRNLVLSRRALMEKEREEMREKLWAELEVGQVREGLVRKIIDVGAFVDLGGLDGFIHVSAMSWGRVKHPSEVLKEGDRVKVTVTKIDHDSNRISLSFKDESLDPWQNILEKYQPNQNVRGRVTSIMPFGAFIELMPGVEGLIHISEISWKRVATVSDALQEGDWVDAKIISIDTEKRKMSLTIKQTTPDPRIEERAQADAERKQAAEDAEKAADAEVEEVRNRIRQNRPKGELKGGVSSSSDGEKFGLKW